MVKYFFSILLLSSCIYFTLFAKPVSEPSWLLNKESVFPSEEYIAFLGEGKSKTTAKNDAISQICSYLNTNIEISVLLNSKAESKNKKTDFSQQLEENISLYSSASIRGLEFTEIYQNKKEKSWHCVAYIKRDDAWNLLLPKIENIKTYFYALYNRGCEKTDPFYRYTSFITALEKGKEFQDILDYARIIHPKNEKLYSEDRSTINFLHNLIITEKNKCTLNIYISEDYCNIILDAAENAFSKTPFVIVGNPVNANYKAVFFINNNKSGNSPLSILPSANVEIRNKENLSIYTKNFCLKEKATAYSLEKAQKKAYPQLAEIMAKDISKSLTYSFDKTEKQGRDND